MKERMNERMYIHIQHYALEGLSSLYRHHIHFCVVLPEVKYLSWHHQPAKMQKLWYWFMKVNYTLKEVGEWRTFHLLPYIRIEFKHMCLEWRRLEYLIKFILSGVIF